jgi:hypothetical protein
VSSGPVNPCSPSQELNAGYHQPIHQDPSNLIPLAPEAFIQKALTLLASDRYLEKGMGLMALTRRRPAEIFFSAKFSLPRKKLPQSRSHLRGPAQSKPVKPPARASSLTPSRFWPSPKRSFAHSINPEPSKPLLPPMPSTPRPALNSLS